MHNRQIARNLMRKGAAANRLRQLKRAFHKLVLMLCCGFTTILVVKGTAGFGVREPTVVLGRRGAMSEEVSLELAYVYSALKLQHDRLLSEAKDQLNMHLSPAMHMHISSQSPYLPNGPIPISITANSDTPNLNVNHLLPNHTNPESVLPLTANHPLHRASNNRIDGFSDYKPSVLLVTGSQPSPCDNPLGDHYFMKSLKNKLDYCRIHHNIELFYNMADFEPQMDGVWAKLPLLHELMMSHPEKEWLWWMDSDAMITDMSFELPMDRYKAHNIILHGWEELVYGEKSGIGLNTGSFLIRNCQWSLNLLQAWAPMGPKGKAREEPITETPPFEANDQSALIYLLNNQKSKWASKVYLENTYCLHGHWLMIADRYEEMMEKYQSGLGGDESWPFVTHFVGCKPCSNKKLRQEDKCLKHMERAFNFADNQVLHYYGLQHEALNTQTLISSFRR